MNIEKLLVYSVIFYSIIEIIIIKKNLVTLNNNLNNHIYNYKIIENEVKKINDINLETRLAVITLNNEMFKTNKFINLLDNNNNIDSDYYYLNSDSNSEFDSDFDFIDI